MPLHFSFVSTSIPDLLEMSAFLLSSETIVPSAFLAFILEGRLCFAPAWHVSALYCSSCTVHHTFSFSFLVLYRRTGHLPLLIISLRHPCPCLLPSQVSMGRDSIYRSRSLFFTCVCSSWRACSFNYFTVPVSSWTTCSLVMPTCASHGAGGHTSFRTTTFPGVMGRKGCGSTSPSSSRLFGGHLTSGTTLTGVYRCFWSFLS